MEYPLTTYIISDTIISSLGFGTQETLNAIKAYRSGVTMQQNGHIADSPILAATIPPEELEQRSIKAGLVTYTRMERLFILAIEEVVKQSGINLADESCGLILATTKGNVELLHGKTEEPDKAVFLWNMAEKIASHFHAEKRVHLISNACISGISALIAGKRMLENGIYKNMVIAGGDLLSHFITSGFHSFRSLSEHLCRPYDKERDGLNLGEGCGAVVLSNERSENAILLSGGAVSNDANHISGPSRTGDGLYLAISQAMQEAGTDIEDISFINAHGTATLYNDEMESKAFSLAHMETIPVQSLKPYFGHTLGASGVIETIICMHELKSNQLFGTFTHESPGVSMPISVSAIHRTMPMKHCLKTGSGFGGCNAAIILSLLTCKKECPTTIQPSTHTVKTVTVENSRICRNETIIFQSEEQDFGMFIRSAYKKLGGNYMKFYKMDDLCKLGYIAAEFLLEDESFAPTKAGILLANASSSMHTDTKHQAIIDEKGDAAASPAIFVYTLPNVVAGEICIRHKIQGENTFFIEREYQPEQLEDYARTVIKKGNLTHCIIGWCNLLNEDYKATFKLLKTR